MKHGWIMPPNVPISIDKIRYYCYPFTKRPYKKESIKVIGIDTEADRTGKCFMIATSEKDVFTREEFPKCIFNRKYRQKNFVAYNLSYDEGAFLQNIPLNRLNVLRTRLWCYYKGYHYAYIPRKCLTIRRKKSSIHIYDLYNFYQNSLDYNAKKYLGMEKYDIDVSMFKGMYIKDNWNEIAKYCIGDSILVKKLADLLIKRFEAYGIYPKKLYSTAYISYQYFRDKCVYVTVKRYWDHDRDVLDYAIKSYNGGKFEVTEKGIDNYYEYDIISAYPYEIRNLINISWGRVVRSKKYRKGAVYGFLNCKINIPNDVYSPVAVKYGSTNTYPMGQFEKVITKTEYEYLIKQGADITIIDAKYIHIDHREYPYKREINRLVKLKQEYKNNNMDLDYHTVKIFLNSLYGKFVQLIKKKDYYRASSCWNVIYGCVITANVRTRISELQQTYNSIVAVHTDSVISTNQLDYNRSGELGDLIFETEGKGLILGSGIYQVGDKVRFRGFNLNTPLFNLINKDSKYINIKNTHAYTWREVAFRKWNTEYINRFEEIEKKVYINFDNKRLWLKDWNSYKDIYKRKVESLPLHYNLLW